MKGGRVPHVLIDATIVRQGGPATYLRHLLPALLQQPGAFTYSILLSHRYQQHLLADIPAGVEVVSAPVCSQPLRRWLQLQTLLPRLARARACDVLFALAEISAVASPCPHVALVRNLHFFAPLRSVEGGAQRLRLLACRVTRQPAAWLTLRSAARLICVSEALRQRLLTQLAVPAGKIAVIHHGVSPVFQPPAGPQPGAAPGQPYVLSVGSLEPHKNLPTLLRAFARLRAREQDRALHLRIAGAAYSARLYGALQEQTRELGLAAHVHFLGHVPPPHLALLYRQARAFILPSRLETFAHPLVEAMASGVPVLASDLPVCREICQDAAWYFAPDDVEALVGQLRRLLDDPEAGRALAGRGRQRAQAFAWQRTAAQVRGVLQAAIQARTG